MLLACTTGIVASRDKYRDKYYSTFAVMRKGQQPPWVSARGLGGPRSPAARFRWPWVRWAAPAAAADGNRVPSGSARAAAASRPAGVAGDDLVTSGTANVDGG